GPGSERCSTSRTRSGGLPSLRATRVSSANEPVRYPRSCASRRLPTRRSLSSGGASSASSTRSACGAWSRRWSGMASSRWTSRARRTCSGPSTTRTSTSCSFASAAGTPRRTSTGSPTRSARSCWHQGRCGRGPPVDDRAASSAFDDVVHREHPRLTRVSAQLGEDRKQRLPERLELLLALPDVEDPDLAVLFHCHV